MNAGKGKGIALSDNINGNKEVSKTLFDPQPIEQLHDSCREQRQ